MPAPTDKKPAPHKPLLPFSPWLLGGVLAVILVLAWVFTPSERDLLARQLRDGANARALETLRGMGAWQRRRGALDYAALEMRLGRELLDTKNADAVRAQVLVAFHIAEKLKFADPVLKELTTLIATLPDIGPVEEAMKTFEPRMPLVARRAVVDALVARALASEQPAKAAAVFTPFWKSSPDTPATAELVRLWRGAGRPEEALAAIETFPLPRGRTLAQVSPALARHRVDLLRETAQPSRALDAAIELQALAPGDVPVERLVALARESNRAADVIDAVKRRAEAAPADAALWRLLGDLAVGSGRQPVAIEAGLRLVALAPGDRVLRHKLGQLYEWNREPAKAFDSYLAAFRLGDATAMDRLLALNPGLYRDADLADALVSAGPAVDAQNLGPLLVRLQSGLGRYDEALKSYERLLRERPGDTALFREYGRLLLDLSEYEKALPVYNQLEALRPGDIQAAKAIAELSFRVGRYEESFARYLKLWRLAPDDATLESCITLAESLGRVALIPPMLQSRLARSTNAVPADFRRLAHFQGVLGDTGGVRDTLSSGVARFPDNGDLRVQLAYALAGERNLDRAVRVLERHPRVRSLVELAHLHASLLLDADRREDAATFLGSVDAAIAGHASLAALKPRLSPPVPAASAAATVAPPAPPPPPAETDPAKRFAADPANPQNALDYAWHLFNARRYAQAERVLKPFLASRPTPGMASLAAQLAAVRGDYTLAEQWQRRYLASNPADAGGAWSFLGDIYSSLGDQPKARAAWQRGLKLSLGTAKR